MFRDWDTTLQMITNGVPNSTIPKSNMIKLLKYVTGGLLQYNKKLFTQIDGVSMILLLL